jgi:hypothetical protein
MTVQITLQDLIDSLRKASANPEAHETAQEYYFSELQDDSVLVHCGTACCIAGDLLLKAHADASEEEIRAILNYETMFTPGSWVASELGLTETEATLAFSAHTHHEIHAMLADILEAGLRLPCVGRIGISNHSTYTKFEWAYMSDKDKCMTLEEVLDWMREIAE